MNLQTKFSFFLFILISCNQPTHTEVLHTPKDSISKDSLQEPHKKLNYIIFGIYCGMCKEHCATMFQYNMMGNAYTLLADYTDSYFKNKGDIKFATSINDRAKIKIAESIVDSIPKRLINSAETYQIFGTPDQTDGCGIYFEFEQDFTISKKFKIDAQTSNLKGDIKDFANFLVKEIRQLKK
jgi:hypothetical protein